MPPNKCNNVYCFYSNNMFDANCAAPYVGNPIGCAQRIAYDSLVRSNGDKGFQKELRHRISKAVKSVWISDDEISKKEE